MAHFPITFGGSSLVVTGSGALTYGGTLAISPTVTITGPIGNPIIANLSTGRQVRLLGRIRAGQTVVCSFAAHTAPGMRVDPLCADWWVLRPGTNDIRMSGEQATSATALSITYRESSI